MKLKTFFTIILVLGTFAFSFKSQTYAASITKSPTSVVESTNVIDDIPASFGWTYVSPATSLLNGVSSSNDSYAVVNPYGPTYPNWTTFLLSTFSGFGIPAGSTITGIVVTIEARTTGCPTAQNLIVQLFNGPAIGGAYGTLTFSTSADQIRDTGSSTSDTFGVSPTVAMVNSSGFGVGVYEISSCQTAPNVTGFNVDQVKMTVYYNPGAATPTVTPTTAPAATPTTPPAATPTTAPAATPTTPPAATPTTAPSCQTYTSTNVPITISSIGHPTINSTLAISGSTGTITDLNVVNVNGTHGWVSDLDFTLIGPLPTSTAQTVLYQPCANPPYYDPFKNFSFTLDDQSARATSTFTCYRSPPPSSGDGLDYLPQNPLSIFNTQSANGTWTLRIHDSYDGGGGSLSGWGLRICTGPGSTPTTTPTPTTSPSSNAIRGHMVDANGNDLTTDIGQKVYVNSYTSTNLGTYSVGGLTTGVTYSVSAENVPGYNLSYSACNNCTSHLSSSYVNGTGTSVNWATNGNYYDIYFKYTPAPTSAPTPTPTTGAAAVYSGKTIGSRKLYFSTGPIRIDNGLIMKIIPLYNSTPVGIIYTPDALVTPPPQGKVITSTGTSGDSKRKVIYFESYPQIPTEIFPYTIVSQ